MPSSTPIAEKNVFHKCGKFPNERGVSEAAGGSNFPQKQRSTCRVFFRTRWFLSCNKLYLILGNQHYVSTQWKKNKGSRWDSPCWSIGPGHRLDVETIGLACLGLPGIKFNLLWLFQWAMPSVWVQVFVFLTSCNSQYTALQLMKVDSYMVDWCLNMCGSWNLYNNSNDFVVSLQLCSFTQVFTIMSTYDCS